MYRLTPSILRTCYISMRWLQSTVKCESSLSSIQPGELSSHDNNNDCDSSSQKKKQQDDVQLKDTTQTLKIYPPWVKSDRNKKMHDASSMEELVEHLKPAMHNITETPNVLTILSEWTVTKRAELKDFQALPEFNKMCHKLETSGLAINPYILIRSLHRLLLMGMSCDEFLIQSLQNDIIWHTRSMSINLLILVLNLLADDIKTKQQQKVIDETVSALQKRWVEITEGRHVAVIFTHMNLFNSEFLNKIGDRSMDFIDNMKAEEMIKIFVALGKQKFRLLPLLRSLAYHLSKHNGQFNIKKSADLLYTMNILVFPEHFLLEKVCSDILLEMPKVTQSRLIGSILTSLGQLRYRHIAVLDAISDWMDQNFKICRDQDIVSFVLTMAAVNFTTSNSESIYQKIIPRLKKECIDNDAIWLDIVWSLVVLRRASHDHISSVLSSSFYRKLLDYQNLGIKLKLLNINAASKLAISGYKGPHLKDEKELKNITIKKSENAEKLSKSVLEAIANFLPPPKFLRGGTSTKMGIYVDGESIIDKNFTPLPWSDYTNNFGQTQSKKQMPPSALRVAICVWDYKDMCRGSSELTGVNTLAVHLLEKLGYTVLQVPFTEYILTDKLLNQVQYLEQKIKDTLESASTI